MIDPSKIDEVDLPLITLSDNSSGLLEFLIKFRTKGDYNHIMWAHRTGFFASQGNTYSESPASRYMKKGGRLKFYYVSGLSDTQKRLILSSIERKLNLPGWKKAYDWIGIFGQAIGIKKINTPGLNYCSEDVPYHLKFMAGHMAEGDTKRVIEAIPNHASPQELNEYFKQNPNVFVLWGKWEADDV